MDTVLTVQARSEEQNLPVERLGVSLGQLQTDLDGLPYIVFEELPTFICPRPGVEQHGFAKYAGQIEDPAWDQTLLIDQFHHWEPSVPVIVTERAWVRSVREGTLCILTVGTESAPGWTTAIALPAYHQVSLQMHAERSGGVIVGFAEWGRIIPPVYLVCKCEFTEVPVGPDNLLIPVRQAGDFCWPSQRPPEEPKTRERQKKASLLAQLRFTSGVADAAKQLAKNKPRDLLLLLLAVDQKLSPVEIGRLNLDHVRVKNGRVYLKGKLVRRKAVYTALLAYRKRDREEIWWEEPLFRDPKKERTRLGAVAIRKILEDYTVRAQRRLAKEAKKS